MGGGVPARAGPGALPGLGALSQFTYRGLRADRRTAFLVEFCVAGVRFGTLGAFTRDVFLGVVLDVLSAASDEVELSDVLRLRP